MALTKRTLRLLLAGAVSITALVAAPVAHAAPAGMKTVTVMIADSDFENPTAAGWGRVKSTPAGIDCPADCQADFAHGSTVTLTLTPTPGYAFDGWQVSGNDPGPQCASARDCALVIDGGDAATVVASLNPRAMLIASAVGAGTLTVAPGGSGLPPVSCGTDCAPRYATGTYVTVTAVPDPAVPGARFVRWSDYRCPAVGTSCKLKMDGVQYLNAVFDPVFLTVYPGSFGPVFVSPPGVACTFAPDPTGTPAPCRIPFELNALATITRDPTVAPDPEDGWQDACSGVAASCTVRMRKDQTLFAGRPPFRAGPSTGQSMRFGYKGPKGGKIIVSGGGNPRSCPKTCTLGGFQPDSRIRITARGSSKVAFKKWSDIKGSKASRSIYVGDPTAVQAIFKKKRR